MGAHEFDVDRVLAIWPRLHGRLSALLRNPTQAYDVIRAAEKAYARGVSLAKALKADRRVSLLSKATQRQIVAAAREDARKQFGEDLLGTRLASSLDDLLRDIRGADPHLATSAFEAGDDMRPRFHKIGPVFVSRHTESTDAYVAGIVDRLENRGLDCWYASHNVLSDWHGETLAAESCGEGLLLLTREALSAPYVSAETKIIIDAGRRMQTLLMEPGVRPRDVNMALENWQFHEWYRDADAAMESLIAALSAN